MNRSRWTRRTVVVTASFALALLIGAGTAAAMILMKIPNVNGDVTAAIDPEPNDGITPIACTSYSIVGAVAASAAPAGTGDTLVPKFEEIVVNKLVDPSSPKLLEALIRKTGFEKVTLYFYMSAGPLEAPTLSNAYMTLTLGGASVTSIRLVGGEDERSIEQVTFAIRGIHFSYRSWNGQTYGNPVTFGWDLGRKTQWDGVTRL